MTTMTTTARNIQTYHEMAEDMAESFSAIIIADTLAELDATDMDNLVLVDYDDEDYESIATQLNGGMIVGFVADNEILFTMT